MSTKSPESKRSLLYLSAYDPHVPLTGSGTRGAEFVNILAERFHLDLVYIDGSGQPPIPELSEKFSSKIKGVREKHRINFTQFDYFVFSRSLYKEAVSLLERNKYDLILCDYGFSALYGIILSRKFNVPFIYCSHNIEYNGYIDKAKKDIRRIVFVPYIFLVERMGVLKSKILVAISENDADFYTRWVKRDKMIVIPQGIDDSIFNPFYEPKQNNPKIVLFCGNFNIQPNRDVVKTVMEQILEKVLKECPNTTFRFIGANPPKNLNHPNVEFTGFVVDYPSCLKEADIFISPMKEGWGSPTKIFEALACGKHVIATPIGSRSVERDYQSLHVCEIDRFPQTICEILKSGEFVNAMDFEKMKVRYSWRVNIQRLIDKMEN